MRRSPKDRIAAIIPLADRLASAKQVNPPADAKRSAPRREVVRCTEAEAKLAGIRRFLAACDRARALGANEEQVKAIALDLARRTGAVSKVRVSEESDEMAKATRRGTTEVDRGLD